jgi:hypothetical protein
VMGMRGGVAVMGQAVISAEWLEMIRHLVQIGALSSTVAVGAIKASGISMATGIGDDPKATADKLANAPKPAETTSGKTTAPAQPAEARPPGWAAHDDEIAEHAMKHFPGKTKEEVIQMIRDVRSNMDKYVAGNGKTLWRKGDVIVIDDPIAAEGWGSIFRPDNLKRFIAAFKARNRP